MASLQRRKSASRIPDVDPKSPAGVALTTSVQEKLKQFLGMDYSDRSLAQVGKGITADLLPPPPLLPAGARWGFQRFPPCLAQHCHQALAWHLSQCRLGHPHNAVPC